MFLMIPYGAVITYSSILAQEKNLTSVIPYFYICLVIGMLASKLSTQKLIDAGKHRILVYASLAILIVTMASYVFLSTGIHLLAAGVFFGLGYGVLQPLFQSFVTGTTPSPKRGAANATYLLSYDIGIGSLLMGFLQESIGLTSGFALTAIAYIIGGIVYIVYIDHYYHKLKYNTIVDNRRSNFLFQYMKHDVYTLPVDATVRDAITYFSDRHISGAPIVSYDGKVSGFISDGDIIRYLRTDDSSSLSADNSVLFMNYFLNTDAEIEQKLDSVMDMNVLDIGSDRPVTISVNASVEDVCRILSEVGIKKIPVIDNDNKIAGIISRSSMTHYLAKRYLNSLNNTNPDLA